MSADAAVLAAGAVSGVVEGFVVQPLEVLKTRAQLHQGEPLRLLSTLRQLLAEGGAAQLFRGALPEIGGLAPRAAAALSTLEYSQRLFRSWHPQRQLTAPAAYMAGALSGVSEAVVFNPFQVIKVRMMAREHLGRYRTSADCLRQVLASEGPAALAIGLAPTLWRNCVWNALFYGTMWEIERRMAPLDGGGPLDLCRTALIGTAVGAASCVFNIPFDVVKSRFQSQLPDNRRYRRVFPTLAAIIREEGWRGVYRGFAPKALRLGIGQTVGLMTFQQCLALAGQPASASAASAGASTHSTPLPASPAGLGAGMAGAIPPQPRV